MDEVGKSTKDFLTRVLDWLGRLFRFGGVAPVRSSSIMLYPLLALLIAGLAYLAAFVILRRNRDTSKKKTPRKTKSSVLDPELEDSRDSDEWLVAARELANMGDYLQALRAAFVATLLRLDAAGFIKYEPSMTNGEYLRATRKLPSFFSRFQSIVRSFDAGWYGHMNVSEAEFNEALEGYRQADELAVQSSRS